MADSSDVEQALASTLAAGLLPAGPSGASALGRVLRLYRGWPDAAALDADLAAGRVNISVTADAAGQVVTTRHIDAWCVGTPVAPSLTASVAGDVAVFEGDALPGQLAGILVNGLAAVHRTEAADTRFTVATALATALSSVNALASGSSVQVVGARGMVARVAADQPALQQVRRQRQVFRIACWCADPQTRDATGAAIDAILSSVTFLSLADGLSGRLRYVSSSVTDRAQAAALYRRDLLYSVEYATTIGSELVRLLFGNVRFSTAAGIVTNKLY